VNKINKVNLRNFSDSPYSLLRFGWYIKVKLVLMEGQYDTGKVGNTNITKACKPNNN
jgi:hypothetical protein